MKIAYVVTHPEVELTDANRAAIEEAIKRVMPDATGFIRLRSRYVPRDKAYIVDEERRALAMGLAVLQAVRE
jgi:hypothetical protein